MRKSIKKVAAVLLTAAMTMSASIMAFADQQVTFHFQNGSNWDTVGAWIYQGISFTTNVSPKDKCAVITKEADGDKIVWPGAKMDDDKATGWKTISATFTDDYVKDGMVMIFNNYVADTTLNDTTTEADLESIKASGIKTTATDTKEQTANIMLNKKAIAKEGGSITDLYITWDGKNFEYSTTAPESYTAALPKADTNNNAATGNDASANNATDNNAAGNSATTGTASNSSAPKTGDTVAVSVAMVGLLAAVAYVASKKKVNA